jgi:aspartokinase
MTIACKFGGTSLADAAQFRKVATIIKADAQRRAVVVSAPGKRHKQDPKVTDILLSIHEMVSRDMDPGPSLALLRGRFLEIEHELGGRCRHGRPASTGWKSGARRRRPRLDRLARRTLLGATHGGLPGRHVRRG